VVSELVANAHEHACGPYELHLRSAAGRYICEIHDGDPQLPGNLYLAAASSWAGVTTGRVSGLLTERGRGLRIVNELAQGQWGFHVTERGTKAAWAVLATASGRTAARRISTPGCAPGSHLNEESDIPRSRTCHTGTRQRTDTS